MRAQERRDDLAEAIVAERDAQLGIIVGQRVVQPARVHPRVDVDIARADEVALRLAAHDAIVELSLELCQVSHGPLGLPGSARD